MAERFRPFIARNIGKITLAALLTGTVISQQQCRKKIREIKLQEEAYWRAEVEELARDAEHRGRMDELRRMTEYMVTPSSMPGSSMKGSQALEENQPRLITSIQIPKKPNEKMRSSKYGGISHIFSSSSSKTTNESSKTESTASSSESATDEKNKGLDKMEKALSEFEAKFKQTALAFAASNGKEDLKNKNSSPKEMKVDASNTSSTSTSEKVDKENKLDNVKIEKNIKSPITTTSTVDATTTSIDLKDKDEEITNKNTMNNKNITTPATTTKNQENVNKGWFSWFSPSSGNESNNNKNTNDNNSIKTNSHITIGTPSTVSSDIDTPIEIKNTKK